MCHGMLHVKHSGRRRRHSSEHTCAKNCQNFRRIARGFRSSGRRCTQGEQVCLLDWTYKFKFCITFKPSETIPQAYRRLDEEICVLESTCPGPRLLTAEAWIEHLNTVFEKAGATNELYERDSRLVIDVRLDDVPNGAQGSSKPETAEAAYDRSRDDTAKVRRVCIYFFTR